MVAPHHDFETLPRPGVLVKTAHLPPGHLGRTGVGGSKDPLERFAVAEQPCLLRHHVVLGGRVVDAVKLEGRGPPLTEAATTEAAVAAGAMAPEEQELGAGAPPDLVSKRLDIANLGYRHPLLLSRCSGPVSSSTLPSPFGITLIGT